MRFFKAAAYGVVLTGVIQMLLFRWLVGEFFKCFSFRRHPSVMDELAFGHHLNRLNTLRYGGFPHSTFMTVLTRAFGSMCRGITWEGSKMVKRRTNETAASQRDSMEIPFKDGTRTSACSCSNLAVFLDRHLGQLSGCLY